MNRRCGQATRLRKRRFTRTSYYRRTDYRPTDDSPTDYRQRTGHSSTGSYTRYGKRLIDILIALPALIVCAPLLLVLALLVRRRLGSPVLFRQQRPGLDGKPFVMLKFRTMTNARDGATGALLPDSERLTPFGYWLRATSLDELPELLNVFCGEMSLVGPRPLLMEYLGHYTPEQHRRHEARPGITGWAQINGRNATDWEQKFNMDVWYVERQSLWLDLKILWRTALVVLRREGISQPGQATAEKFRGGR